MNALIETRPPRLVGRAVRRGLTPALVRTGTLADGADRCDFRYLPAGDQCAAERNRPQTDTAAGG